MRSFGVRQYRRTRRTTEIRQLLKRERRRARIWPRVAKNHTERVHKRLEEATSEPKKLSGHQHTAADYLAIATVAVIGLDVQ